MDHVEEEALMREAAQADEEAILADEFDNLFDVEYLMLDETTPGIKLLDREAELEFAFDPRFAPMMIERIRIAHEEWVEADPTGRGSKSA